MNDYDLDILRLGHAGYCCAQIVVLLGLEQCGVDNPGLARAMSGLCYGFSSSQGACGVLTGGACLLAWYAGKGAVDEEAHERLPLMLSQLSEWFEEYTRERFGGIQCSNIVSDGQPNPTVCGGLVGECFGRVMAILMENGLDPQSAPHG